MNAPRPLAHPPSAGIQPLPWGLGAMLLGFAVVAAYTLWHVVPAAWSDASTLAARSLVAAWAEETPPRINPQDWAVARKRLEDGIAISPDHAQLRAELGYVYFARAQSMGKLSAQSPFFSLQMDLLDLAIEQYRVACALRPTFPYTWAQLALTKHYRTQVDSELWTAFDQAMRFGKTEAALQPVLTEIALMRWDVLDPQRRQAVADMIRQAKPKKKTALTQMVRQAGVQLEP